MSVFLRTGFVAAFGALAGCDGAFESNPTLELPENGALSIAGQARSAEFTGDILGGTVVLEDDTTTGATVQFQTRNGEVVALTVTEDGAPLVFDTRDGDVLVSDGVTLAFVSPDGRRQALFLDPGDDRFDHQTFGVWLDATLPRFVGAGTFGIPTEPSAVPAGGTTNATFSGLSTGWVEESGDLGLVVAVVQATTDFQRMDFQLTGSQVTQVNGVTVDDPRLDMGGNLEVNSGGFAGVLTGTGSIVILGATTGRFYGPNANEIGGTFTASNQTINYFGSFGAVR